MPAEQRQLIHLSRCDAMDFHLGIHICATHDDCFDQSSTSLQFLLHISTAAWKPLKTKKHRSQSHSRSKKTVAWWDGG